MYTINAAYSKKKFEFSLEADDQIDGPINVPDSLTHPYGASKFTSPAFYSYIELDSNFMKKFRISGNVEECPCYAGLDEQLFYNAKYEMAPDDYAFSTITGELKGYFGKMGVFTDYPFCYARW